MSKALLVCYKNKRVPSHVKEHVQKIEEAILPDNLTPNPMDLKIDNGTISCIFNPVDLKQRQCNSLCLGIAEQSWWKTNTNNKVLEGSYAVFREDDQYIELQTDAVGSRTIWYFVDDEKIIASNSQLAIIYYLGNFEFNENIIPWMLSSGTLGPYLSWDSRIQFLKPQSTFKLSKEIWEFNVIHEPIVFSGNNDESIDTTRYLEKLSDKIDSSIQSLPFDKKILLPLSGGYDSRGILLSLVKNNKKIPAITWGSKDAIKDKGNDAYIAKELANHYGLKHNYVHTEDSQLNVKVVIDRFLINSEGRTDNIAGYMDGFQIWNDIFENDCSAIVRGDEAFGSSPVYSEEQVRSLIVKLTNDYTIFKGLEYKQSLPNDLLQNNKETLTQWRDRLFHSFTTPVFYSALNETKSSYVEVINPLQSYSILKLVRELPDTLRDDKKLFRMFVEQRTSPIPFATKGANISHTEQLKKKEVVSYFVDTIKMSTYNLIDKTFVNDLINSVTSSNSITFKMKFLNKIKKVTPKSLKSYFRGRVKHLNYIDNHLLIFRVFIIYKMNEKINNTLNN